jgi:pyruvate,water dikinase
MGAEHSRPLDQLRGEDERLFGGKSAGLGELIGSQIPVPPGFALSVTAFQAFLGGAGLEERIAQELSGLDPANVEAVRVASTAIVDAVRAEPVPEAIAAEVAQRYSELAAPDGEADPPVAVRSSALGEDSAEAAFAGQQETYLWVRGADGVCTALRDCWASLYSPEAISYRAQMAAEQSPAMGVAVQRMVDAAVSGVTFTCNPVNGDPSTVAVNASWGLGLAVVGGEVTPDEYRVSKVTGEVLQRTVGPKQVEYLPDPAGGGTVRAQVPAERQQEPCLDEEQLSVLVDLARRIERHFGSHQDIEWAIARVGTLPESLFVLQSRPVTTSLPKDAGATRRQSAMALVMSTFGAARDAPER